MTKLLSSILLAALPIQAAFAAQVPLKVTAENGKVEFTAIGKPSALKIPGKATGPSGELRISPSGGSSNTRQITGELTFELTGLDTGIGLRNEHMKTKYLEVEKFPKAKLTLDPLVFPAEAGDTNLKDLNFSGKLTLHGVEKPVQGITQLKSSGGKWQADARFKLRTSDFGIPVPSYMGITVTEIVEVHVELSAQ